MRGERGMTLIEATIVLTMVSILAAASAPSVSRTLAQARLSRAKTDVEAIKTAIDTFLTTFTVFTAKFTSTGATGGDTIEVLVSDGDTPLLSSTISGLGGNNLYWDDAVTCCGTEPDVSFLENHLVLNSSLGGAGSYSTAATGWKGAYINAPIDSDPWGNRYAVNTAYLAASTANDVIVMSAGPDEEIDTQYVWTTGGAYPGDDDIITVIRRDSALGVP